MKRTPRSRSACTVGDDVVGAQRDVLHARTVVVLDVLLDLALPQTVGGLVDRHDDLRAVPHDRRHQRGVLGGDLVVVEVLQLAEADDLGVEAHPVVEPALFDVADDVIDAGQADRRARPSGSGRLSVGVAGLEQLDRGSGCG